MVTKEELYDKIKKQLAPHGVNFRDLALSGAEIEFFDSLADRILKDDVDGINEVFEQYASAIHNIVDKNYLEQIRRELDTLLSNI